MCKMHHDQYLADLGHPDRVWSVPAIHGDLSKLTVIHDYILERFQCGDRVVYHGNYTGYGEDAVACVDEILTFRRLLLSVRGVKCEDLVYLRGQQEEIWEKLIQLQFAPDSTNVLLWMLGNGLSPTLYSYKLSPHDGIEACRAGVIALTKWTQKVRDALRAFPGHEIFHTQLKRAALTAQNAEYPMLFVHAGLDPCKPLQSQGDCFWWPRTPFENITAPYLPFQKVIRGYDPQHGGLRLNCITATLDAGCGFGGALATAAFMRSGEITDVVEA